MKLPASPVPVDPLEDELRKTAARLRLAERSAELDALPAFPWEEFRALAQEHWIGLRVPPTEGGRGLGLQRSGRLLHALARVSGTTFAKLALQPDFCSVLADHGSESLKERYYRPMVAGRLLVGNHLTEPEAGSDLRGIRSEAHRQGDRYVLTGSKSQAAFAVDADAAIVYARVDGAPEATAFLVPQKLPGISRNSIPDLGERWMRRGSVQYDAVEVPADHRIGAEGDGWEYAAAELLRERALLGMIYLGVARGSWELTVERVGDRTAFRRPLSAQQAVSFPLSEDWARLDAAELYVDRVLGDLDRGEARNGPAALAKWLATETALTVLDHAIQFHGGAGYSKAFPHEQRWRDVRSGAIAHGPSEVMRLVAARDLWPRSAPASGAGAKDGSPSP